MWENLENKRKQRTYSLYHCLYCAFISGWAVNKNSIYSQYASNTNAHVHQEYEMNIFL